jgi:hypothetical protein
MSRLDRLADNGLVARISEIADAVRELKTGNQYVEAKMFTTQSSGAFDVSGTLGAAPGTGYALALFSIVVQPLDGKTRFQSQMVPKLFAPNQTTQYEDTGRSRFDIRTGINPSLSSPNVEYYYSVNSRNATAAEQFYFKYVIYATTPVIVSIARVL